MYEKLDLVKELHALVHKNDLDRDKRALTNQRCVIIVTPALTAKQERLKKNEEERKNAEEEKARKLLERKKQADEANARSIEERKAVLSAKDAQIKYAEKEKKELLKEIASLKATIRSSTERTPHKSARKRKSSATSTSSASNLQCSQAWEDVLNTTKRTRETSVVENLGANRDPGKRSIKRKLQ
jgi:septal ring factor EnvC (AmiA/AmiB activator)